MEQKSSTGKTIALLVIVLLVLGIIGGAIAAIVILSKKKDVPSSPPPSSPDDGGDNGNGNGNGGANYTMNWDSSTSTWSGTFNVQFTNDNSSVAIYNYTTASESPVVVNAGSTTWASPAPTPGDVLYDGYGPVGGGSGVLPSAFSTILVGTGGTNTSNNHTWQSISFQ